MCKWAMNISEANQFKYVRLVCPAPGVLFLPPLQILSVLQGPALGASPWSWPWQGSGVWAVGEGGSDSAAGCVLHFYPIPNKVSGVITSKTEVN